GRGPRWAGGGSGARSRAASPGGARRAAGATRARSRWPRSASARRRRGGRRRRRQGRRCRRWRRRTRGGSVPWLTGATAGAGTREGSATRVVRSRRRGGGLPAAAAAASPPRLGERRDRLGRAAHGVAVDERDGARELVERRVAQAVEHGAAALGRAQGHARGR